MIIRNLIIIANKCETNNRKSFAPSTFNPQRRKFEGRKVLKLNKNINTLDLRSKSVGVFTLSIEPLVPNHNNFLFESMTILLVNAAEI